MKKCLSVLSLHQNLTSTTPNSLFFFFYNPVTSYRQSFQMQTSTLLQWKSIYQNWRDWAFLPQIAAGSVARWKLELHHHSGIIKAKVAAVAALTSFVFMGLPLGYTIHTIPVGFKSGKQTSLSSTAISFDSFGAVGRCSVLLGKTICLPINLVSRWNHEVESVKWLCRLLKNSWPATADGTSNHHKEETPYLTSNTLDSVPPFSRT